MNHSAMFVLSMLVRGVSTTYLLKSSTATMIEVRTSSVPPRRGAISRLQDTLGRSARRCLLMTSFRWKIVEDICQGKQVSQYRCTSADMPSQQKLCSKYRSVFSAPECVSSSWMLSIKKPLSIGAGMIREDPPSRRRSCPRTIANFSRSWGASSRVTHSGGGPPNR